jgi:hypothetical protein
MEAISRQAQGPAMWGGVANTSCEQNRRANRESGGRSRADRSGQRGLGVRHATGTIISSGLMPPCRNEFL